MQTLELKCAGRNRICSTSKQEHVVLRGKHVSGINKTKWAEPYPLGLCRRLAYLVWQSFQVSLINISKQRHVARTVCPGLLDGGIRDLGKVSGKLLKR